MLDRDRDGAVEQVAPVARGLNVPNGVAISPDGWLYAAENTRVVGFPNAEFDPLGTNEPVVVYDALPAYRQPWWR